jgi:ankyrin repeat protein
MYRAGARLALAASGAALACTACEPRGSRHPDAEFYAELDRHRRLNLSLLAEARLGEWYEVRRLIDRGDSVTEAEAESGATALHLAAREGKKLIVEWLLRAGADCAARDAAGRTPCAWAASANQQATLGYLLATPLCAAADVNERDRTGATLLHRAAASGAHATVRTLLRHPACDPNAADAYGTTPLHKAVAFGHEQVVGALLGDARTRVDQRCAEPTAPDAHAAVSGGESALHLAAGHEYYASHARHTALAKALLGAGASPNAADKRGRTAAHRACAAGNEAICRLLLKAPETDWAQPDDGGATPYELALRAGHAPIASLLRERGHAHGGAGGSARLATRRSAAHELRSDAGEAAATLPASE